MKGIDLRKNGLAARILKILRIERSFVQFLKMDETVRNNISFKHEDWKEIETALLEAEWKKN